jgi:hypothetical protein
MLGFIIGVRVPAWTIFFYVALDHHNSFMTDHCVNIEFSYRMRYFDNGLPKFDSNDVIM